VKTDRALIFAITVIILGAVGQAPAAGAEQVVISVPEMHCVGCANAIREALRKLPHVQRVSFDFPAKTITAHTADPGQLTESEIRAAVAKLNYKVADISRSNESK
jgi:copper chaperone CopZ